MIFADRSRGPFLGIVKFSEVDSSNSSAALTAVQAVLDNRK